MEKSLIHRLIFVLFLIVLAIGCTPKPQPAPVPAPPPIQHKPVLRKVTPKSGDTVLHKCTATKIWGDGTIDCVCRDAAHKIDSKTGEYSLECKREGH